MPNPKIEIQDILNHPWGLISTFVTLCVAVIVFTLTLISVTTPIHLKIKDLKQERDAIDAKIARIEKSLNEK